MPSTRPITLTDDERAQLQSFLHHGTAPARILTRARLLLKAGDGWTDAELVEAFDVCGETVRRVRRRFVEDGLQAVLHDRPQAHHRQALSGAQAAHLIAVACTAAPDGHDHWTLRLLARQAVELGYVVGIAPETIRALLKKTNSSPGSIRSGASPH